MYKQGNRKISNLPVQQYICHYQENEEYIKTTVQINLIYHLIPQKLRNIVLHVYRLQETKIHYLTIHVYLHLREVIECLSSRVFFNNIPVEGRVEVELLLFCNAAIKYQFMRK